MKDRLVGIAGRAPAQAHGGSAAVPGEAARLQVELLAPFRSKSGTRRVELAVPSGGETALQALRRLDEQLSPRRSGALDGLSLRKGVLLFVRGPGEPMRRIEEPGREMVRGGQTLVLATAMEGG
ncbi:MAG: hypothetical protein JW820_04345 [Spirochaetales bacterium]|nr:hypothetical protein [Spirochaetales bacterium]